MTLTLNNHKVVSWNIIYSIRHWGRRKALVDDIHKFIFYEIRRQKIKKIKDYPISISIVAMQKRPIDADNINAKLYIDGLKIAGVIEDDSPKFISSVSTYSRKRTTNSVEIEFWEG